jgi:hypothetical protein
VKDTSPYRMPTATEAFRCMVLGGLLGVVLSGLTVGAALALSWWTP